MENKVFYVTSREMAEYKKLFENDSSLYAVELNGSNIHMLQEYLTIMTEILGFPFPSRTLDGYNDWMCDLDWLEKDGYVLVIYNYKDFLSQDLPSKKAVRDGFVNIILPWWQQEVETCVVGGKVKAFNLYLVD